jgi:hypothetical protein
MAPISLPLQTESDAGWWMLDDRGLLTADCRLKIEDGESRMED